MSNNFISNDIQDFFNGDASTALDQMVSCMFCGIIMAKRNDNFVLWNEEAQKLLGKPQADIPLEQWSEYYGVYDDDGKLVAPHDLPLAQALAGQQVFGAELFIKNEMQPGLWIVCKAAPITRDGNIIGAVIIFQDINEEKLLRNQIKTLLERQQKCLNMLDNCPAMHK